MKTSKTLAISEYLHVCVHLANRWVNITKYLYITNTTFKQNKQTKQGNTLFKTKLNWFQLLHFSTVTESINMKRRKCFLYNIPIFTGRNKYTFFEQRGNIKNPWSVRQPNHSRPLFHFPFRSQSMFRKSPRKKHQKSSYVIHLSSS